MRKIMLAGSFLLTSVLCTWAQAPQQMSYQAVIRDVSGTLIVSSGVSMKVSILQGSSGGPVVFSETHTGTTNTNGLLTTQIGAGLLLSGNFSTINWGNGPYFLKTETDPTGGTNYSVVATTQLLSVPYALYAETAGNVGFSPSYLYLEKKATVQSLTSGSTVTVNNYDSVSTSGFTLNNGTGVITFNVSGVYIINVQTSFDANNIAGRKMIWLECSSANWESRIASNESGTLANRMTTTFMGEFNTGDTIKLMVAQYTGSTIDCPSNTLAFDETLIGIERLR